MRDDGKLMLAYQEIERLRAELDESFVDDTGTVWTRPTAFAYYAVCTAHRSKAMKLRKIRQALDDL